MYDHVLLAADPLDMCIVQHFKHTASSFYCLVYFKGKKEKKSFFAWEK